MPAIGYVTKQNDGSYKGELKTLSIRTALEIRPNPDKQKQKQPDYRVVENQTIEIRAAWIKVVQESRTGYIQPYLAAPEFGRRKLLANLGKTAGGKKLANDGNNQLVRLGRLLVGKLRLVGVEILLNLKIEIGVQNEIVAALSAGLVFDELES
jgi:uncharacterized protein (DUF736 family)